MCHIAVDSGLNSIVHIGSTGRPLEPYEGQLNSIFGVLLLKYVTIIPFHYSLCAREVTSGVPLQLLKNCSWFTVKWLELDLLRSICPPESHRTRVLFQWHSHIDTCYRASFLYSLLESNKYLMSSPVFFFQRSLYLSIFFPFCSEALHNSNSVFKVLFASYLFSVACCPSE